MMAIIGLINSFATAEMALDAIYDRLNETGYRPLRMAPVGDAMPFAAPPVTDPDASTQPA